MFFCTSCKTPYPEQGLPYICPECGGIYDGTGISFRADEAKDKLHPGIWRYRATFGLPENAPVISLGEGNTPLVWGEVYGRQVAYKCEFQNPTGSFKDRGTSTLVSYLSSRGAVQAIEDSSGNAGASFAAYAARAGILARIYVPETASGPKRKQIEAYGAEVVVVSGTRTHVTEVARRAADAGLIYASHAYLPFNLAGYATIAYEIFEQLGECPGTFICPVGQGGLLLGAARGFKAMAEAGITSRIPRLIGVQAMACAPLYGLYRNGFAGLEYTMEESTLAEGVRVRFPVRARAVVRAVNSSQGRLLAVSEADILTGRDELAHRGFYVEATSAIVWTAITRIIGRSRNRLIPEPVVVVLTGSGLKTT